MSDVPTLAFVRDLAARHRFTQQELRRVVDIALDLRMWGEDSLERLWPKAGDGSGDSRAGKKRLLDGLTGHWERMRWAPNRYGPAGPETPQGTLLLVR